MNILLLDGGKDFGHSHGELNHTLHKKAKEILTALLRPKYTDFTLQKTKGLI